MDPSTEYPTLRIAHLYPSLLNVAGDGGNVTAIVQRCAWRGITTEVVPVELGEFSPQAGQRQAPMCER